MSLWSVSKLLHMHNQDIRHTAYQMLQLLVLFLTLITFHLYHLWLAVKTHASVKADMDIFFWTLYAFRLCIQIDVSGETDVTFWEVNPIHIDPEIFTLGYPVYRNFFLRYFTATFKTILLDVDY